MIAMYDLDGNINFIQFTKKLFTRKVWEMTFYSEDINTQLKTKTPTMGIWKGMNLTGVESKDFLNGPRMQATIPG